MLMTHLAFTFISLINMEAGINMEGVQNQEIDKCGRWASHGKITDVEGG